jgi:hypothetical protein
MAPLGPCHRRPAASGYGTEWDFGLHGHTLEQASPVTQANALLKRVRKAFDDEAAKGTHDQHLPKWY